VAFLPLGAIPTLLIGGPMIGINALSSFPYQQEIRYHYAALVVGAIILATVEAIARLGKTPSARAFLVGLVCATSLASTVAWGPSPISTKYRSGLWALYPDARQAARDRAVAMVPARAPATVHYQFAPHMTHRQLVYEWPVPWRNINWGVRGENLHDPGRVQWLVLDRQLLNNEDKVLLDGLLASEFAVQSDEMGILVAKRVRPPGGGGPQAPPP
jgi:hypothetical protein